jgi:nitrogen fixation/metabolism regulation signal transduction histidine kinase
MSDTMKIDGNTRAKGIKLYVAGAVLLLLAVLVFVQAAFDLARYDIQPSQTNQIFFFYTLSTCIFVVLLIFLFIFLRMLVKVWIERKQQIPGSKFKTSLLVSLVGLMLIPAVSLFAFAYGLVNRSIDKWFSVPVDGIFDLTKKIDEHWRIEHQALARSILAHLAADLPSDLDRARTEFRLRALVIIDPQGKTEAISANPDVLAADLPRQVLGALGEQADVFFSYQNGWMAAQRIYTANGDRILAALFPAPEGVTGFLAETDKELTTYHELIHSQRSTKDNYVLLLALMTVLVLFAAVWVALFLSKRITAPIAALSEATREISAGNLEYRVNIEAQDELGMLVGLFNDMAGRLQGTTAELETRRRYMEVILESIPTGVISLDTDLRVHTLNRAARTMLSVENVTHLDEIFTGNDLTIIVELLAQANENTITREIAFATRGRPAHSAVTANRLTTGGFVLVVEDLTEVVRAQKANAWREVARRLAHEIKNPLTPIQLSAERIARNVARLPAATPRISAIVQECVDTIVDEVSSLKNLVDEFVRFARLPRAARMPNSMQELIEKTLALYEGRMEGIALTVQIPNDLPSILMDSMQMKRVLINLIDNALEAMSGELVKALAITCDLTRGGTMARLTIEDTGRGIAPEDRERLFTPYFSTRKNGTGLGLAIASRIVADHDGYIGVEPNTARGARFVIELPICQESSLSMTSQASATR